MWNSITAAEKTLSSSSNYNNNKKRDYRFLFFLCQSSFGISSLQWQLDCYKHRPNQFVIGQQRLRYPSIRLCGVTRAKVKRFTFSASFTKFNFTTNTSLSGWWIDCNNKPCLECASSTKAHNVSLSKHTTPFRWHCTSINANDVQSRIN